jgi:uncharacterized protein YegP (UPF0339 family)
MAGKFEIYKDKAGEFRFRLKASNGQTVLASEGYSSKASAKKGIASVEANCADPARFESTVTRSGQHRFAMTGKNKQVIGQSQGYKSASARNNGIEAVARAAKGASVVDLSD